jgi:N-acetylmuramoyl-L-alanine amidase
MNKLIILDNGHGDNTPGKRSPVWPNGSQLFEYEFNRDIVKRIKSKLDSYNIDSVVLVPELDDISLAERCKRANKIYDNNKECVLLSIHANAGGGTG